MRPAAVPYSRPGALLGSYAMSFDKVWVEPTSYIGWDQHPIYEYKANLMDAHLDHPSEYAGPMGFNQKAGEIYWISIVAEVGHKLELVVDATGVPHGSQRRPASSPHRTPKTRKATIGAGTPARFISTTSPPWATCPCQAMQWEYFGWQPIQPRHELFDMAFELYTVPEPIGASLMAAGMLLAALFWRQNRL